MFCTISCIEISLWKKPISNWWQVIFILLYRAVFELAQDLRDWTIPEKIGGGERGEDIEFSGLFKK